MALIQLWLLMVKHLVVVQHYVVMQGHLQLTLVILSQVDLRQDHIVHNEANERNLLLSQVYKRPLMVNQVVKVEFV